MPHTWTNLHDERAVAAGARRWGPGIAATKSWAGGLSADAASPPPRHVAANETRRLVATRSGAVLVMLGQDATDDEILAALQDAHTRVQREIHARRAKRVA